MKRNLQFFNMLCLGAIIALGACTQTSGISANTNAQAAVNKDGSVTEVGPAPAFTEFTDIPIPTNAKMDLERTLILGGGETWAGRLAMSTSHGAFKIFDLFKQEFPKFGWQEVMSLRSETSVLTYERQGRIATVQIQGTSFGGSDIIVTVAPKASAASPTP